MLHTITIVQDDYHEKAYPSCHVCPKYYRLRCSGWMTTAWDKTNVACIATLYNLAFNMPLLNIDADS